MFIRPQPLHLFGLGIEWLTPQRAETVVSTIFMFIRPQPYTCLGIEWLTQGGVVKQASLVGEWSTIFHAVYKWPQPLYTCLGIECPIELIYI